jgi:hypothetical protein
MKWQLITDNNATKEFFQGKVKVHHYQKGSWYYVARIYYLSWSIHFILKKVKRHIRSEKKLNLNEVS